MRSSSFRIPASDADEDTSDAGGGALASLGNLRPLLLFGLRVRGGATVAGSHRYGGAHSALASGVSDRGYLGTGRCGSFLRRLYAREAALQRGDILDWRESDAHGAGQRALLQRSPWAGEGTGWRLGLFGSVASLSLPEERRWRSAVAGKGRFLSLFTFLPATGRGRLPLRLEAHRGCLFALQCTGRWFYVLWKLFKYFCHAAFATFLPTHSWWSTMYTKAKQTITLQNDEMAEVAQSVGGFL